MGLKKSDVGGPYAMKGHHFPIGDKKHARLAIGGATRSYNAGNISKSEEEHIKSEARKELSHRKRRLERKYGHS